MNADATQGEQGTGQGGEGTLDALLTSLQAGGGRCTLERLEPVAWGGVPLRGFLPAIDLEPTADAQTVVDTIAGLYGGGRFRLRPLKPNSSRWSRGGITITIAGEPRVSSMQPPTSAPGPAPSVVVTSQPSRTSDVVALLQPLAALLEARSRSDPRSDNLLERLFDLVTRDRARSPEVSRLDDQLSGLERMLSLVDRLGRRRTADAPAPRSEDDLGQFMQMMQMFSGPQRPPWPPGNVPPWQGPPPPTSAPPWQGPPPPTSAPPSAPSPPPTIEEEPPLSPAELADEVASLEGGELEAFLRALQERGVLPGAPPPSAAAPGPPAATQRPKLDLKFGG